MHVWKPLGMRWQRAVLGLTTTGLVLAGCSGTQSSNAPTTGSSANSSSVAIPPQTMEESGTGDKLLRVTPFTESAVVDFNCSQDMPLLEIVNSAGKMLGVNTAGSSNTDSVPGRFPVNYLSRPYVAYNIRCPGAWTLSQAPITSAKEISWSAAATGTGSDVLRFSETTSGLQTLHCAIKGELASVITLDVAGEEHGSHQNIEANSEREIVIPDGTRYLFVAAKAHSEWTCKP